MKKERPTSDNKKDERILLLLPHGREAALVHQVLSKAQFHCLECPDVPAFVEAVEQDDAGAAVLCDRVLLSSAARPIQLALQAQPVWSDLPVLVLSESGPAVHSAVQLQELIGEVNIIVLERPMHPLTLVAALHTALRDRRRQYQVRDQLHELEEWKETLEQRVAAQSRNVRQLATKLTMAEQRERHRISSVLHDHVQQLLYGIQIHLQLARRSPSTDAPVETAYHLDQTAELLDEAVTSIRSLTVELSPPVLEEGLVEALKWLAHHTHEVHGFQVVLNMPDACQPLTEEIREVLFQSTRELIFNAVKHSGVDYAHLSLKQDTGACIIEVTDEGKGFDLEAVNGAQDATGGFGLFKLQERMGLIGGHMDIDTVPGQGTRITLMIPIAATR